MVTKLVLTKKLESNVVDNPLHITLPKIGTYYHTLPVLVPTVTSHNVQYVRPLTACTNSIHAASIGTHSAFAGTIRRKRRRSSRTVVCVIE